MQLLQMVHLKQINIFIQIFIYYVSNDFDISIYDAI